MCFTTAYTHCQPPDVSIAVARPRHLDRRGKKHALYKAHTQLLGLGSRAPGGPGPLQSGDECCQGRVCCAFTCRPHSLSIPPWHLSVCASVALNQAVMHSAYGVVMHMQRWKPTLAAPLPPPVTSRCFLCFGEPWCAAFADLSELASFRIPIHIRTPIQVTI
jgi:hypothetical protein